MKKKKSVKNGGHLDICNSICLHFNGVLCEHNIVPYAKFSALIMAAIVLTYRRRTDGMLKSLSLFGETVKRKDQSNTEVVMFYDYKI